MTSTRELQSVSDDELLRRLSDLLSMSRRVEVDLVAHIGEVDVRRLYAREACSSMFAYATDVLHLSEHEAYERITAARASRRFPLLLEMLRDGRLHLSGIGKLAPHLTRENHETLVTRAAYRTKRQIEELLAELSPRPDVPSVMRKLPERQARTPPAIKMEELGPDRVASPVTEPGPPKPPPPPPPPARPVLEPLAPSRYKIQFTASGELRDKLERLQDLMYMDLAAVIEAAVTEKLERLEAKRFAETKSPRKTLEETDTSPRSRYMPAAVRRFVRKRDGNQCRFVSKQGRRCPERRGLEFHHEDPFGRGGDHDPEKICLMCRRHNAYLAEREYGKDVMNRYRRNGDRVSETAPVYGTSVPGDSHKESRFIVARPWPKDGRLDSSIRLPGILSMCQRWKLYGLARRDRTMTPFDALPKASQPEERIDAYARAGSPPGHRRGSRSRRVGVAAVPAAKIGEGSTVSTTVVRSRTVSRHDSRQGRLQ